MSGPKKYLRTESGERIDQPDFEHAAEESQLAGLTQLGEAFIVGSDAGQKNYVLSGFRVTNPSLNTVEIAIGSGILSWKDQGNVEHGVMIETTIAETVGLSSTLAGAGAHGVYIRFNLQDAQQENRNFWNALAVTPVETPRQIATRRVDSIDVNFKPTSPGTEWMLIAEITPSAFVPAPGSTTGITDKRVFYFEGAVADSYSAIDDWGGGTDRNVDRATYGLKGLRQFVRATQSQLFNIISPSGGGWSEDPTTLPTTTETGATQGLSLAYAKSEAFSRLGDAAIRLGKRMSGNLIVSASNTYNMGEQATPWADIHSGGIWLGLERLTAALADDPRILIKAAAGNLSTKILTSIVNSITPDGTTVEIIRVPPVSADLQLPGGLYGTLAIAVNCSYDNTVAVPTGVWTRYDNAKHSYLLELGTAAGDGGGMRLWFHHEASNTTWDNTGGGLASDWTLYFGAGMRDQTVGTTTGVGKNSIITGQVELPTGGLVSAGDVTVGGFVNVQGHPPAYNATLPNTAISDNLMACNIPRAWANIYMNAGVVSIGGSIGISSVVVSASPTRLLITMSDSFASTTSFCVVGTWGIINIPSEGTILNINNTAVNQFELSATSHTGTKFDFTTDAGTINLQVMGHFTH